MTPIDVRALVRHGWMIAGRAEGTTVVADEEPGAYSVDPFDAPTAEVPLPPPLDRGLLADEIARRLEELFGAAEPGPDRRGAASTGCPPRFGREVAPPLRCALAARGTVVALDDHALARWAARRLPYLASVVYATEGRPGREVVDWLASRYLAEAS